MFIQRLLLTLAVACSISLGGTSAKAATSIIFLGSTNPWILDVNGRLFYSLDTGFITSNGGHNKNNAMYTATINYGNAAINNWGVFDLSSFTGPVHSASLSLYTGGVFNGVTYTLFDTRASLAELDKDRTGIDPTTGIALHNDLGSGIVYGSRVYYTADAFNFRTIALNSDALSAIQSAAGGQFALGGAITASEVPEPSTWSLMILGVGAVGFTMRRKSKTSVSKAPA